MPDVGHTLCWPGEAGDTWPGYRDACASTASTGGRLRTALRQEPWGMVSLRLRGPYHFARQSLAIPGGHGAGHAPRGGAGGLHARCASLSGPVLSQSCFFESLGVSKSLNS